jgi:hypothetical protein
MQKDRLYIEASLLNPFTTFHATYRCREKGRDGSPTYDEAGFELDWEKVNETLKPQAYNKKKIVRGMENAVSRIQRERDEMFRCFFVEGHWPDELRTPNNLIEDFLKDQVSKDLGVLHHQVGPETLKQWRERGFQPVRFEEWWKEPNEEERKRMRRLSGGKAIRKDF